MTYFFSDIYFTSFMLVDAMDFAHLALIRFFKLKTYLNNTSEQCVGKMYDVSLNDDLL